MAGKRGGRLEGQTALVTGGGSGIGRAVVDRFVEEGCEVGVLELSHERVALLREDKGDGVLPVQGDVTSLSDNERAVAEVVEEFGGLDIFVGNAGIFDNMEPLQAIPGESLEGAYDELFGVNVKGYLFGAKAAIPELMDGGGTIIFTISVAGLQSAGGGVLYTASKHAVVGITRQLALELAPDVRVNGVAPGFVPTNLQGLATLDQGPDPDSSNLLRDKYPLRIVPDAEAYSNYFLMLASSESAMTTGHVLPADCGSLLKG